LREVSSRARCDELHAASTNFGALPSDNPQWLTREQAAAIANLSVRSIDRAIARGTLKATKLNGSVRISLRELDRWLDAGGQG
jgi:excisionase family DNA binding protein